MNRKLITLVLIVISLTVVTGCTEKPTANSKVGQKQGAVQAAPVYKPDPVIFSGIRGESLSFINDQIQLDESILEKGVAYYFNTELDGETIYFFVVQDKNGVYRAAGNACQVCADAKKGFDQVGNDMVCNTCGNKYPLEKIATEKGGCNPVPVNPNLKSVGGKLIIEKSDFEELKGYF
ncbi:DUF2318 domain-containing protein [Candidatus Kuenenbacteria bacterium]|nr:DUF2318 domain-containing protein [Candidatus Kuenenbacteria bacterium]